MEGPFHDLGSSDGRISSVLDLLNKSADKSLCSLLKSDDLARESFVRLGVPLGSDSDRLRFRNWGVRHKEVQEDISFASWSPGGAALCLLSRTGALCIAPASAPLERVSVALHQEGSRARWLGEEAVAVCSGGSRRLSTVDVESLVMESFDCGAATALQDCVGHSNQLYAGARDGAVYVWDRRDASVRRIAVGRGGVGCLDVSRDGQMLVTGSTVVDCWDTRKTVKPIVSFSQHQHLNWPKGSASTLSLSALQLEPESNSRIAVQSADGFCSMIDLASQSIMPILTDEVRPSEAGLAFLPGGAPWIAVVTGMWLRLCSTTRGKVKKGCSLELPSQPSSISYSETQGMAIATRGAFFLFGDKFL